MQTHISFLLFNYMDVIQIRMSLLLIEDTARGLINNFNYCFSNSFLFTLRIITLILMSLPLVLKVLRREHRMALYFHLFIFLILFDQLKDVVFNTLRTLHFNFLIFNFSVSFLL